MSECSARFRSGARLPWRGQTRFERRFGFGNRWRDNGRAGTSPRVRDSLQTEPLPCRDRTRGRGASEGEQREEAGQERLEEREYACRGTAGGQCVEDSHPERLALLRNHNIEPNEPEELRRDDSR